MPWIVTCITQVMVSEIVAGDPDEAFRTAVKMIASNPDAQAFLPFLIFRVKSDGEIRPPTLIEGGKDDGN